MSSMDAKVVSRAKRRTQIEEEQKTRDSREQETMRERVIWSSTKLHTEMSHNFYSSRNISMVIKTKYAWAGQIARTKLIQC